MSPRRLWARYPGYIVGVAVLAVTWAVLAVCDAVVKAVARAWP